MIDGREQFLLYGIRIYCASLFRALQNGDISEIRMIEYGYRFMRVMVFFDLPTETPADRREYGRVRRFLVKSGFLMLLRNLFIEAGTKWNSGEQYTGIGA